MKTLLATAALAATTFLAGAQTNDLLEIKSLDVVQGSPTSSFTGEARNVAGRVLRDAVIRFNLYDNEGRLVGNAEAHATNIEPDGIWKFQGNPRIPFYTVKVFEIKAF